MFYKSKENKGVMILMRDEKSSEAHIMSVGMND